MLPRSGASKPARGSWVGCQAAELGVDAKSAQKRIKLHGKPSKDELKSNGSTTKRSPQSINLAGIGFASKRCQPYG